MDRTGMDQGAARTAMELRLQLAQMTPECLEYVIVHELVHLLERNHNARFYAYMDRFYPGWMAVRADLNRQAQELLTNV